MTPIPLRRPTSMRIDAAACVRCELCDAVLPGVLAGPERIPVSPAALEAMAVCPTGAIVWCEDEASAPIGSAASGALRCPNETGAPRGAARALS